MATKRGRMGITRRSVLKGAGVAALTGFAASSSQAETSASQEKIVPTTDKIRGVNLGGWLVLERWLTPSLFGTASAQDEYSFCNTADAAMRARLKAHHETFISNDDFAWIAEHGLNAVRIPVGYWILESNPPFLTAAETLDRAFQQAEAHGLKVLIDLHGAPGSQNGWDHSGKQGALGWHTSPENIEHTLRVIDGLADRYAHRSNLLGIELLNEPRWDVPLDTLKDYYKRAYTRLRTRLHPDQVIVYHDGFRPFDWEGFMPSPDYTNVILDTHMYQCYTDEDRKLNAGQHAAKAAVQRKEELDKMQKTTRAMVGEWSDALDPASLRGLSPAEQDLGKRAYASAQLLSYESTAGWFFWTYRTENIPEWSYRTCVERGWMPGHYSAARG